ECVAGGNTARHVRKAHAVTRVFILVHQGNVRRHHLTVFAAIELAYRSTSASSDASPSAGAVASLCPAWSVLEMMMASCCANETPTVHLKLADDITRILAHGTPQRPLTPSDNAIAD